MNSNDKQKITPSGEIIEQLAIMADNRDSRSYRRLMDKVDWRLASSKLLDKGIDMALAFVDMRRAKTLTEIGLERFPKEEIFSRTWLLFNPRPARIVKSRGRSSPEKLQASMDWLREHAGEYEPGYWLAVKAGQLIASAPTLKELDEIIETIGGAKILATNSIVHQVIT